MVSLLELRSRVQEAVDAVSGLLLQVITFLLIKPGQTNSQTGFHHLTYFHEDILPTDQGIILWPIAVVS